MNNNWKPGDIGRSVTHGYIGVFVDSCSNHPTSQRQHWHNQSGSWDPAYDARRRLVVLDLDDSEKAALLERAERSFDFRSITAAAIRDQCSPLKPEEPTGLGAVVEDADGTLWFRMALDNQTWPGEVWQEQYGDADRWSKWESVAAVRVLSEGVTA